MGETETLGTHPEIDYGLLEHARLGLKRIHTISQSNEEHVNGGIPTSKSEGLSFFQWFRDKHEKCAIAQ